MLPQALCDSHATLDKDITVCYSCHCDIFVIFSAKPGRRSGRNKGFYAIAKQPEIVKPEIPTFVTIVGKNDGRTTFAERTGENVNLEDFIKEYIEDHEKVGLFCSSVIVTIVFPPSEGDYRASHVR